MYSINKLQYRNKLIPYDKKKKNKLFEKSLVEEVEESDAKSVD